MGLKQIFHSITFSCLLYGLIGAVPAVNAKTSAVDEISLTSSSNVKKNAPFTFAKKINNYYRTLSPWKKKLIIAGVVIVSTAIIAASAYTLWKPSPVKPALSPVSNPPPVISLVSSLDGTQNLLNSIVLDPSPSPLPDSLVSEEPDVPLTSEDTPTNSTPIISTADAPFSSLDSQQNANGSDTDCSSESPTTSSGPNSLAEDSGSSSSTFSGTAYYDAQKPAELERSMGVLNIDPKKQIGAEIYEFPPEVGGGYAMTIPISSKENNCMFNCLGAQRQDTVQQLHGLSNNPQARSYVAGEVKNLLSTIIFAPPKEVENLRLREKLLNNPEFQEKLNNARQGIYTQEVGQELFEAFLDTEVEQEAKSITYIHNASSDRDQELQSLGTLDLIAELKGKSIRVFTQRPGTTILRLAHEPYPLVEPVINLLHNLGTHHFDFLQPMKNVLGD